MATYQGVSIKKTFFDRFYNISDSVSSYSYFSIILKLQLLYGSNNDLNIFTGNVSVSRVHHKIMMFHFLKHVLIVNLVILLELVI